MSFTLPALDYAYDALEPSIDARTMEIHHTKHHQAYINNLNNAIKDTPWENRTIEEIMASISTASTAIRNNGGGHYNHSIFWKMLSPNGGGQPGGDLLEAINSSFGSFDQFKEDFSKAAATRFGSGWAWLVKTNTGLAVTSTPNQDNPLMDLGIAEVKGTPILALDVWEHAYYLHYQNRRPDYITAFFNVINWKEVSSRY